MNDPTLSASIINMFDNNDDTITFTDAGDTVGPLSNVCGTRTYAVMTAPTVGDPVSVDWVTVTTDDN